jgi:hypothetical protein
VLSSASGCGHGQYFLRQKKILLSKEL